MHRLGAIVAALVVSAGCGGSRGAPSGPTPTAPAAPSLTSLTIDGPDAVLTNTSADYTATAIFSNQTTQTVTVTWTTGGTNRASVNAGGRVTGQAHGSFTLTAAYQGTTASKTVNVVNNYDGRWSGVVRRVTCQLNGALGRRITQRLCPAGSTSLYPMAFTVSQPAPSFANVTVVINNPSWAGSILNATGTVSGDGRLTLEGVTEFQSPDPVSKRPQTVRYTVLRWDTVVSGVTLSVMSGRFDLNRTESLWQGNVCEEYEIDQMRRAF